MGGEHPILNRNLRKLLELALSNLLWHSPARAEDYYFYSNSK